MDVYSILHLQRDKEYTIQDINRAKKKRLLEVHPDKGGNESTTVEQVQQAAAQLTNLLANRSTAPWATGQTQSGAVESVAADRRRRFRAELLQREADEAARQRATRQADERYAASTPAPAHASPPPSFPPTLCVLVTWHSSARESMTPSQVAALVDEPVQAVKVLSRRDRLVTTATTGDRGALVRFASSAAVSRTLTRDARRLLAAHGVTVAAVPSDGAVDLPPSRSTVRCASGAEVPVPSSPRRGEEGATLHHFETAVKDFVTAMSRTA
uniref:J domain-containing protein n=1 Tax=Sexangularia sp. CB-2014 TaxID=1486929 RepID=A0A7S1VKQ6_9EUKA